MLPVPKPGFIYSSAIFFSSDRHHAAKFGSRVTVSRLSIDAKILNALTDTYNIEQVRLSLLSHPIFSRSLNVDKDFWHSGWASGEALEFHYKNDDLEHHFYKTISSEAEENDIHPSEMKNIFFENLNRNLINQISSIIKSIGFDGIYCNERITSDGKLAPMLILMSSEAMSEPKWFL
ncbi:hypothetical protein [Acinetobacter variabilis]|uniref:hypothetical protein n=1 Tax=Acinetobacter variabilis TaxID=70346 RepID=UPI0028A6BC71|nr:hypothetical protein [Acinetobacter variabilis]